MPDIKKNDTAVIKICCAVFFLLFTFIYVYAYQADILAMTQHVLSHGATHYDRTIGALLITLFVWLVHALTYAVAHLRRSCYALTYFPAFLILGILTDVTPNLGRDGYWGNWVWGFPLILVFYAFVVYICRQLESIEQDDHHVGLFSRLSWVNMLIMLLSAFMTCSIGSSDEVFHWRMRAENSIMQHRYDDALEGGALEEETDSSLTLLRIWALSEKGQLGDRLFTYPVVGGSAASMPNGTTVRLLMVPEDSLYRYLGVKFKQRLSAVTYLEKIHEKGYAKQPAHDWLLTAYLLDCNLEKFVATLPKFYSVNDSLPLHFREALTLYTHLKEHPSLEYHQSVMDTDFDDYSSLSRKYTNRQQRYTALRDSYGKTYWFYYSQRKGKSPIRAHGGSTAAPPEG
jgi:hypothetical protein